MANRHYSTLRLVLGDQLNASHSWFKQTDDNVLYLIAELRQEATYVKHHIQKVSAFFAAMAAFSSALKQAGHHVCYMTLDETQDYPDLPSLIVALCEQHQISAFEYQRPDEYRLWQQLSELSIPSQVTVGCVDTEHFLLPYEQISSQFTPNKHRKMEYFYRDMRRQFGVLMDGDSPEGGRWNYDQDNRNKLKKSDVDTIPAPLIFTNDVRDILTRIERHQLATIGEPMPDLLWPITRSQAKALLEHFCRHCLPLFGQFQDAMTGRSEHQWSLYHSRLSFALNAKLLHPMQVITAAIEHFRESETVNLAQIEGFVRQILGWREYIRGVYWTNMPAYAQTNALAADRQLPGYFWDGDTKMRCMSQAITQSLQTAYAHHIQRLMVTGNFCLLAGIEPDAVDDWYLAIYIDAIEWVEMPNTRGMTQFADNGLVGTKPYAASGAYINRMSDYCSDCHYSVKEKVGEQACPLNALYWHFMQRHRDTFGRNPRMAMPYRNWDKMEDTQRQAIIAHADGLLDDLDSL
ncbi:cryptochrome/photolyase family protein [Salinivibrio sp. ES.052]|uniref:cryptochrome/photolyase family protein n=1 Tax=Salinivibrio sp. ES.052 TaxID=1882823 RepID=UPI000940A00B|nr:cryptochrome/photolyase family protein [Salinivibrio sp. ES.052]